MRLRPRNLHYTNNTHYSARAYISPATLSSALLTAFAATMLRAGERPWPISGLLCSLLTIVHVAGAIPVAEFYDFTSSPSLSSGGDASAEVAFANGTSFVFYGTAYDNVTVSVLSSVVAGSRANER